MSAADNVFASEFVKLLAKEVADMTFENLKTRLVNVSPWLSPDGAAEYLGVSKRTIEDWAQYGKIRRHKIAGTGHVRYHREELDAALLSDGGKLNA